MAILKKDNQFIRAIECLCEEPGDAIRLSALRKRFGADTTNRLIDLGALLQDACAEFVICDACYEGHEAALHRKHDGSHSYYCPEAGWQSASTEMAASYKFAIEFVLGLFVERSEPIQEILQDHTWMIGEFEVQRKDCTIIFAAKIGEPAEQNRLREVLTNQISLSVGLLVTSTDISRLSTPLPNRWIPVGLSSILEHTEDRLQISERKLVHALAMATKRRFKVGTRRSGRSSTFDAVVETRQALIDEGLAYASLSNSKMFRLLQEHWARLNGGAEPPGRSTIMDHLRKVERPD